jgi:beta-mannosidase
VNQLNLDGQWQARWSDYQRGRPPYAERDTTDAARYIPVQVPGEIHLDLMSAGLLDDVYVGLNVLKARWVEEQIWSYRREFEAPAGGLATGARAWLEFDGLDYAAEIVLNGKKVGEHANSFLPCRLDVTGLLRPGMNVLAVHLDSGLYAVTEKTTHGWYHGNARDQTLHKRHWLRKPQSQFSWDWSPRLINVGIHGSVRLQWTEEPVRFDRFVPIASVSDDLKTGIVRARVLAENLTGEPVDVTLDVHVHSPTGDVAAHAAATVSLKPGSHAVEVTAKVDSPDLWWPVGHGAQPLYDVAATLSAAGKLVCLIEPARVGFRHIRVDQSKHPESGSYFILEINHRPIFCKGANLVPADMIFARIDRARYETLVDRALEANFNLLRIWGGGLYESDDFYDLCDERGILVWQEFIFACGRYPTTDEDFNRNVKAEARHQVRRLAHHASLVIWCGNNENETMHWSWGPGEKGTIAPDYALYHLTLPRILAEEDGTRYYQPSSPLSPDRHDPSREDMGDQHPWGVGFGNTDFRDYRKMVCRFPNEGGILGPVSLPTMRACFGDGEQKIQNFAFQTHDNSVDSWQEPSTIDHQTMQWLGKDCRSMTVEEYTYWGGLVQAEGLREYVDHFRRRMFDSAAAVFWMYNDCWPASRSWTIVDYYLNRTPSFYHVKRAMQPISVVLSEVGEEVAVFGINDTREPIIADLRFGLFMLAGEYVLDRTVSVTLAPNASTRLATFPRSSWTDPTTQLAFAVLSQSGQMLARNRLILPLYKDLKWAAAKVKMSLDTPGHAVFTCDRFAFNVCLDLDGTGPLPDNMFDLYPDQPHTLPWSAATPPRVLFVGNVL